MYSDETGWFTPYESPFEINPENPSAGLQLVPLPSKDYPITTDDSDLQEKKDYMIDAASSQLDSAGIDPIIDVDYDESDTQTGRIFFFLILIFVLILGGIILWAGLSGTKAPDPKPSKVYTGAEVSKQGRKVNIQADTGDSTTTSQVIYGKDIK